MGKTWAGIGLVLVVAALAVGANGGLGDETRAAALSGERDGLRLDVELTQAGGVIAAEAQLENRRGAPVFLVPDQCGRVTEALLVRTKHAAAGRAWAGSVGQLNRLVLERQRSDEGPERMAPRVPGGDLHAVPRCERPSRPVRLAPGDTVKERWESDPLMDQTLAAVGSEHTKLRVEVVEARGPAETEYLDIVPAAQAETARAGRRLRVEQRASAVIDRPPQAPDGGRPSPGLVFDRLLENGRLRSWLAAQPDGVWRSARLTTVESEVQFRAVTAGYERAVTARARADGSDATVVLPRRDDRIRRFRTRPATLPSGIRHVRDADGWSATRDVVAGRLELPSGRVVTDGFPGRHTKPLEPVVDPGAYPVYVTLARHGRKRFESVALTTLVVSEGRPVRWRRIGGIGVDGGVAAFTSPEGARLLDRKLMQVSDWDGYYERAFDSLTAHDNQVTELPIAGELNQVMFSTGGGDGGYPVLAGFDAQGRPARFVLDFFLLHLRWPGRPER